MNSFQLLANDDTESRFIPTEILLTIFSFLEAKDLYCLMMTSTQLKNLTNENKLWFHLFSKSQKGDLKYDKNANYKAEYAKLIPPHKQLETELLNFKSSWGNQRDSFATLYSDLLVSTKGQQNRMEILIGAMLFEVEFIDNEIKNAVKNAIKHQPVNIYLNSPYYIKIVNTIEKIIGRLELVDRSKYLLAFYNHIEQNDSISFKQPNYWQGKNDLLDSIKNMMNSFFSEIQNRLRHC